MRRRLEIIVTREIFKNSICPSKSNKRFFPSKKTIRAYMLEAIRKKRYSNIDQECLIKKVEQWKVENPHRKFYLRPKGISENYAVKVECSAVESTEDEDEIVVEALSNSFLFVYQTEEMQRLLKIYGNEITLLDATYKTTKYSLPLFFLVVKTNVDYQIVGTFICEGESTKNIQSGLAKIKEWNPNWNPLYFMVDCCAEEINAIESLHQECQVLICDFHREQAWERWFNKVNNGASEIKIEMLAKLRKVARAQSNVDLAKALENLKKCEHYLNPNHKNMFNWLEKQWLPHIERWAYLYRKDRLMVSINTNNGVERQNETFKHSYLKKHSNSCLSTMLTILIENYFPDLYNRYCEINTRQSGNFRRYSSYLPTFLHHRPRHFVKHCLQKMSLASHIDLSGVFVKETGKFACSSFANSAEFHHISFGDSVTMPNCTCQDWKRTGYLCKHFFAVFNKFPSWSWYNLSQLYIYSPFLNLDKEISFERKPLLPQNELLLTNNKVEDREADCSIKTFDLLPKQNKWLNTKASLFRELAKQLINESYLVENEEKLDYGIDILKKVKKSFDECIPNEQGIHLQPVKNNKRQLQVLSIPLRKKVALYSGRHGIGAEKLRASSSLKIEVNKNHGVLVKSEEIDASENIILQPDNTEESIEWIMLDNNLPVIPQTEIDTIENNDMLTDISINAAQKILLNQFHMQSGFQDTILGEKYMFREEKNDFVQVLYTGQYHWITISNVNCPADTIFYYDSLFHGQVKDHVKQQICNIYKTKGKILTIHVRKCQQQTNGVDCGIFAIANALNILHKFDIGALSLDKDKVRKHFIECIKKRHFSAFPVCQSKSRFNEEKIITLEISCSCRSNWVWYHAKNTNLHMVQCDMCSEWYHKKCENISDEIFNKINAEKSWICLACKKKELFSPT
ncbi:uncharacterized protein LOC136071707 isoform X1 [Hydra vulgaris]|uniref:uncharacterized protein LOC136071707 isoform X1 n=2 Tax=Hydra vulgaris TaxID=6087 RepID=UPI0032EA3A52